jgi:hypothetical protein
MRVHPAWGYDMNENMDANVKPWSRKLLVGAIIVSVTYIVIHISERDATSQALQSILEENNISGYALDFISVPYTNVIQASYEGSAVFIHDDELLRIKFDVIGESPFGDAMVEIPANEVAKLRWN